MLSTANASAWWDSKSTNSALLFLAAWKSITTKMENKCVNPAAPLNSKLSLLTGFANVRLASSWGISAVQWTIAYLPSWWQMELFCANFATLLATSIAPLRTAHAFACKNIKYLMESVWISVVMGLSWIFLMDFAMMEILLMEMAVLQPVTLSLSFPAKMEIKYNHLHVFIKEFL